VTASTRFSRGGVKRAREKTFEMLVDEIDNRTAGGSRNYTNMYLAPILGTNSTAVEMHCTISSSIQPSWSLADQACTISSSLSPATRDEDRVRTTEAF